LRSRCSSAVAEAVPHRRSGADVSSGDPELLHAALAVSGLAQSALHPPVDGQPTAVRGPVPLEAAHQPRQGGRPWRARIVEEDGGSAIARGDQADATGAGSEPLESPLPAHSQVVNLPIHRLAPLAYANSAP